MFIMRVMIDLLKPDWKKFIIPLILFFTFLMLVKSFFDVASVIDKNACKILSLLQEANSKIEENDIKTINKTYYNLVAISKNITRETKKLESFTIFLEIFKKIDPLFPFPCEFVIFSDCRFYINENTYKCLTKDLETEELQPKNYVVVDNDIINFFLILSEIENKEYKKASADIILINILLLFLEGYLISIFIILIYRKIRKRFLMNTEKNI